MLKFWTLAYALTALLYVDASAGGPAAPGDEALASYFRAYLDDAFRTEPMLATRLGDRRHDGRLDDISAPARAANLDRDRAWLADLPRKVARETLTRGGRIDYEILEHHLARSIWLAENFDPFVDDPRVYGDYLADSVYLVLTQSTRPKAENVANVSRRMDAIPGVVDVARATIGAPPRVVVETAIRQAKGAIGFYQGDLFTLSGESAAGPIGTKARAVVEALKRHVAFLETEVLPRSTAEGWRVGEAKFSRKLELELDAGLAAAEVLAEARSEADRVLREMAVLAKALWSTSVPGEPVPPDDESGRRAMTARVLGVIARDRSTPEGLLADVRGQVAEVKSFIASRDILRLPEPDRLQILEMPEFRRGNSTAYLDPAPPLDRLGPSVYAVSPPPSDWDAAKVATYLGEYNKSMLKILTIHEAYPGHYVQLEYGNRCPSAIRSALYSGTFAEGWAVYTEQVMLDQGFGGGDLGLRLQQLKFYLRAVVNAILDHEMHCGTMTDAQAMDLLVNGAFQTEGEALGKVIRSKQSSTQLSTYFVGRTAFYRLRQSVQRELGDTFDLGRYHEAVLDHGTLPVKYLPELVRARLARPR